MWDHRPATKKDAYEVDVDYLLPSGDGVFPSLHIRPGDAGVGHENIDCVVLGDRRICRSRDCFSVRNIQRLHRHRTCTF